MLLEQRGARVVHGPTIATSTTVEGELRAETDRLIGDPPEWLVATTGAGMQAWMAAVDGWGWRARLLDALRDTQVVARGPKAAAAVTRAGVELTAMASGDRSADVVSFLAGQGVAERRVALLVHGDGATAVVSDLARLGAEVVTLAAYRWEMPADDGPAVRLAAGVVDGAIDAVTFTSAPAIRNFFTIVGREGLGRQVLTRFAASVGFVCVGPVSADEARSNGVDHPVEPVRARLGPMVAALCDTLANRRLELMIGGIKVAMQGAAVTVEGMETVHLSERERALLSALMDRPGQVIPRTTLLRQVWGSNKADPHTLEVTVARLRRRLGEAGQGVKAVPRRGYVLEVG